MAAILLLEINEVPWRLIDRYADSPEFPNLRAFFAGSHQFTSVAVERGELSPWVTWPTVHRGMNSECHGILNLGQDPSTFKGCPIWQEVRDAGGRIGVCGSMQSWPPIDPGPGGFYIPDTFAHDESCIPDYVNGLQAFNLDQVRGNARVVDGALPPVRRKRALLSSMARSGIRAKTVGRILGQLLAEPLDPARRERRPIFQTILYWDVFRKHFDPDHPPELSTFFTNHIAGVMHRYWCDVFPEDFGGHRPLGGPSREPLMRFALRVLDEILEDAMAWARRNPDLVVIFATSMGQAAVHRDTHEGVELLVTDLARLAALAGLEGPDFRPLLAMVPQVALEVADATKRRRARTILEAATFGNGERFVAVREIGASLSVTIGTPSRAALATRSIRIAGCELPLDAAGLGQQAIDPGTGYHVPEGSLAVFRTAAASTPRSQARAAVPADRLKSWMLEVARRGDDAILGLEGDRITTAKPHMPERSLENHPARQH